MTYNENRTTFSKLNIFFLILLLNINLLFASSVGKIETIESSKKDGPNSFENLNVNVNEMCNTYNLNETESILNKTLESSKLEQSKYFFSFFTSK